jgi:nucleoid-associated protein YgaU
MRKTFIGSSLAILLLLSSTGLAMAAEKKMTREEFDAQLVEYTQRETDAVRDIADCDDKIATLNRQIKQVNTDISSMHNDLLRAVASTDPEINAYDSKLDAMIEQLEGLNALAPEELFHHQMELKEAMQQLSELKQSRISAIPAMNAKIGRIDNMLTDLNARRLRQITTNYIVERGDNLWNIAQKEVVYDDPYMWPRLYRANRESVKDPDLIFPKQVLAVPYGVRENQYLVSRGDFLTKIAAEVYNDPTKWRKIYNANKDSIYEPGLVFPAQVLEIPSN